MTAPKAISCETIRVACEHCSLGVLCLPMGLAPEDVARLDDIIERKSPLHRGEQVFQEGAPFRALYVVKSGSVKSYARNADGEERVLGFHLPGELIGLDGIADNTHACSAKVLETSAICEIPYAHLETLSAAIPSLQQQMYRLLSKQINRDNEMLFLLANKNADERLATFLINLSGRLRKRGLCATDFYLSMPRHDIASYLNLSAETVSRRFTRFEKAGLLDVHGKHVQRLDIPALEGMLAAGMAVTSDKI